MELNFNAPRIVSDVAHFIAHAQPELISKPETKPSEATIKLARELIYEEVVKELLPTLDKIQAAPYSLELMAQLLDDIVDSIYVLIWTSVCMSLPFNAAWHEVSIANIKKVIDKDGKINPIRDPKTGKIQKPEGWIPPDVWGVLNDTWKIYHLRHHPEVLSTGEIRKQFHGEELAKITPGAGYSRKDAGEK